MMSLSQKTQLFGKMHMFRLEYYDLHGRLCSHTFEAKNLEDAYLYADKYLPPLCEPLDLHMLRSLRRHIRD